MGALLALPVVQKRGGACRVAERACGEVFEILFPKLLSLLLYSAAKVDREDEIVVVLKASRPFVEEKKVVAVEGRALLVAEGVAVGKGARLVRVGKVILEKNAVKRGVSNLLHLSFGFKAACRLLHLYLLGVARYGSIVRHTEIAVGDAENTLGVVVKTVGLGDVLCDGGGGVEYAVAFLLVACTQANDLTEDGVIKRHFRVVGENGGDARAHQL